MECTLLFWPSQSELDPGFDMSQNESDLAGPMEKKINSYKIQFFNYYQHLLKGGLDMQEPPFITKATNQKKPHWPYPPMKLPRWPKASVELASHADVLRLVTPSSPVTRSFMRRNAWQAWERLRWRLVWDYSVRTFKQFCSRLGDLSKR